MDRFACYLPGWEMLKNSSDYLTNNYGFITDYLAEAFHHQFAHSNRYEEVNQRIRLGAAVEGRDEKGIKKTVAAFLKILHPDGPPSDAEFDAVRGLRRRGPAPGQGADEQAQARRRVRPHRPVLFRGRWAGGGGLLPRIARRRCHAGAAAPDAASGGRGVWLIKIGRGLDFYQKPATWHEIGVHDLALRKCLETKVDVFQMNLALYP